MNYMFHYPLHVVVLQMLMLYHYILKLDILGD
jgi:hypothetical protein